MSCGAHHARTCSECHPTNRHWCNGDCAWDVNQCVPKGAKKHLHTYLDCSQSSFYFIPQGSTVRDPPPSLVKDQAFYVFFFFSEPFPKVCALRSVWSLHQQGPAGAFFCGQCFVSPGIQQVCSFFQPNSYAGITNISF